MFLNKNLHFHNPTVGRLSFQGVIEEVFGYINGDDKKSYEVVVGCDSASDERPSFPVALVVLKKGYGGRFFLAKIKYPQERRFPSLQQRILEEVFISCELALEFREALKKRFEKSSLSIPYQFEYIHADVGGGSKTQAMIKEVVGLIKSNGFEAKVKPEAFAASIVADRFT